MKYDAYPKDLVGRIPECLGFVDIGEDVVSELIDLISNEFEFNFEAVSRKGWTCIHAADSSGFLDNEKELISNFSHSQGVSDLFICSRKDIISSEGGKVSLARIPDFTEKDIQDLQVGAWFLFDYESRLYADKQVWLDWVNVVYFTLPLSFVVINSIDGKNNNGGFTTIVGVPELIRLIKKESSHGIYKWADYP